MMVLGNLRLAWRSMFSLFFASQTMQNKLFEKVTLGKYGLLQREIQRGDSTKGNTKGGFVFPFVKK